MALSDITQVLGIILTLFDKLAFIILCFFFGNLSFKGWKGKKTIILRFVIVALTGIICFFGGLILRDLLGWSFFASDYLSSLIIAGLMFVLLTLISSGFKVTENYATKNDINSLAADIKKLKIQVAKLTKALDDKKITPEPLDEEKIKDSLSASLEKKGVKKYELLSLSKIEDAWSAVIHSSRGKEEVIIDAYTGSLTQISPVINPFQFLYKNPLSTLGFLLLASLLLFLFLNISLTSVNALQKAFDFTFLFENPLPEGCASAEVLLENFKENKASVSPNNTLLAEMVLALPDAPYIINSMTRGEVLNSETYYLTTSYSSEVNSLAEEITLSDWSNIYNVRVCGFKSDYTPCNCIGGEQTDAVFTAPYLVELGFIEDALENIILGSLNSVFSSMMR